MENIITLIVRTLSQAPIFLGIIAFVGLLLQKKKPHEIIEGVAKTVVGMVMLSSGAGMLTNTLSPLITKLNAVSGVTGVIPQNFAVFGEVMETYSMSVVLAFLGGFVLNLILVKVVPWKNCKNVYLTIHVSLILCSFLVVSIPGITGTSIDSWQTILIAAIALGIYNTFSPAISRRYTKDWTNDSYTLGHNLQLGTFFAHHIAKFVGSPDQDAENLKLPQSLSILKDNAVSFSILMPLIFIGIGLVVGSEHIIPMAGSTQWLVWLFLQGITFTAGFLILLQGVRMFIAQILPAFKGIADRFAKDAIPALDCAIFYPLSPTSAMLGFLAALAGGILATLITIVFKLPVVVFPSPNIIVFDGSLMGVFGNKAGGWKGAVASAFILSLVAHLAVIFLYPLTGYLYGSGATYSQTDYSIFWMPLVLLFKQIGHLFGLV